MGVKNVAGIDIIVKWWCANCKTYHSRFSWNGGPSGESDSSVLASPRLLSEVMTDKTGEITSISPVSGFRGPQLMVTFSSPCGKAAFQAKQAIKGAKDCKSIRLQDLTPDMPISVEQKDGTFKKTTVAAVMESNRDTIGGPSAFMNFCKCSDGRHAACRGPCHYCCVRNVAAKYRGEPLS